MAFHVKAQEIDFDSISSWNSNYPFAIQIICICLGMLWRRKLSRLSRQQTSTAWNAYKKRRRKIVVEIIKLMFFQKNLALQTRQSKSHYLTTIHQNESAKWPHFPKKSLAEAKLCCKTFQANGDLRLQLRHHRTSKIVRR